MQNFHILTGAPGGGKTTLLQELRQRGYRTVDEPARAIIAQQRAIDGCGVSEKDPRLFTELMLSRMLFDYDAATQVSGPVIFDRGLADLVGYARLFGIDDTSALNAARRYSFYTTVYVAPDWAEIYETDDERKMTFEQASAFGKIIRQVYTELSYNLVDLPLASPPTRADWIVSGLMST